MEANITLSLTLSERVLLEKRWRNEIMRKRNNEQKNENKRKHCRYGLYVILCFVLYSYCFYMRNSITKRMLYYKAISFIFNDYRLFYNTVNIMNT